MEVPAMKKGVLAALTLAFSFALFVPASNGVEARSNYYSSWRERVCERIERSEIRAWNRFDQDKRWRARSVQWRIDLQDRFNCQPDGTIIDELGERKQFTTLATALTEAGLVDTLKGDGDFTVFAPTDQAFEKLGTDTINAVLADKDLLTDILTYHVVDPVLVPNAVPSETAVTLDSAPMFNGDSVDIELRGKHLFVNDSKVVVTDIQTTNGIVHVIDTVLLP